MCSKEHKKEEQEQHLFSFFSNRETNNEKQRAEIDAVEGEGLFGAGRGHSEQRRSGRMEPTDMRSIQIQKSSFFSFKVQRDRSPVFDSRSALPSSPISSVETKGTNGRTNGRFQRSPMREMQTKERTAAVFLPSHLPKRIDFFPPQQRAERTDIHRPSSSNMSRTLERDEPSMLPSVPTKQTGLSFGRSSPLAFLFIQREGRKRGVHLSVKKDKQKRSKWLEIQKK